MTRIKFVDVPPFQDATKIEARLMATLRRLRDLPRQPARTDWEDEDDSEQTEKGKTITYDDTKKGLCCTNPVISGPPQSPDRLIPRLELSGCRVR